MRKRYILFDRIIFWVITLMTVMPSFLSAYTAIDALATEVGTVQTSLPMDNGTASASGTINGSGTAVDWVVTVTKFDSVDERAPNLELEYSNGLGAPYNISMNVQQINRPDMGAVTVLKRIYIQFSRRDAYDDFHHRHYRPYFRNSFHPDVGRYCQ